MESRQTDPDGYSTAFFQTHLDVLKEVIRMVFISFARRATLRRTLKLHSLSLFKKKSGEVDVKEFRTISLVDGVYKTMTRVLANRIKSMLSKIISNSQNASINGRKIILSSYCQLMLGW